MQSIRYATVLFMFLGSTLSINCWIGKDGVPQKGLFHAVIGRSFDDLGNVRKSKIDKAIKEKDTETFTQLFHDTDTVDFINKLVSENNVEFLKCIDDKFDHKIDFRQTYHTVARKDNNLMLLQAMEQSGFEAVQFLLEHGFSEDVGIVLKSADKTVYEIAVSKKDYEFTKLFMGHQYRKDPKKIDPLATTARGFVQAHCVASVDPKQCRQSRDFFIMYIQEARRLGVIDDVQLAHSIAKDPTLAVALKDYIQLLNEENILLDSLVDSEGNDLMHITIGHNNPEGMQLVARNMKQLKRENANRQRPGDIARSHLKVCEQHSIHTETERRYREECKQFQKFYDAYKHELQNNKQRKILEKEKQEQLRIEEEKKQLEREQQEAKKLIEQEQLEYEQKMKQLEETYKKKQQEIEQVARKKNEDFQQKEHTLQDQVNERKELWDSKDDISNK